LANTRHNKEYFSHHHHHHHHRGLVSTYKRPYSTWRKVVETATLQ